MLLFVHLTSHNGFDASAAVVTEKKSRQSHGSTTRGSANDAQKIVKMLNTYLNESHTICFGAKSFPGTIIDSFSFKNLPNIKESDMIRLAGAKKFTPKAKTEAKNLQLSGTNEIKLQECLGRSLEQLKAIDTHTSIGNAVEFMLPRDFGGKVVYSNTCKADLTSSVRRMVYEVKSPGQENSLVVQMLERLVTSLDISHVLRNSIVFGATPSNGFIFIGTRDVPVNRGDANKVSLHLFKVSLEDSLYMWQLASNIENASAYLTSDAPLVLRSLSRLEVDSWLCRIHLLDWSQHRVYDITLPEKVQWPESLEDLSEEDNAAKKSCIAVECQCPHFAMKVIRDDEAFKRELRVLTTIEPGYFISGVSGNGEVTGPLEISDQTKKLLAKRRKTLNSSKEKDKGWWSLKKISTLSHSPGGVLIMRVGENVPHPLDHVSRCTVFTDCIEALQSLHEKGYCHTDLRLPNLLKFDEKYEPVDFGDAVKTGTAVCIEDFSEGRRKLLTAAAAGHTSARNSIEWNVGHDIEMLARAVFGAPVTEDKERDPACPVALNKKRIRGNAGIVKNNKKKARR